MAKKSGSNQENLEHTRRVFIKMARKEFVTYGFANASTNRIVEKSEMARGSLYYHFEDKRGLFAAVYRDVLKEMEKKILKDMAQEQDIWCSVKRGLQGYIECCKKREIRRILIESFTALGYEERLRVQQEGLLGTMQGYLQKVYMAGYFKGHDTRAVTIAIYGMITEAGRSLEFAEKPDEFMDVLLQTHMALLDKMAQ